MTPCPRLTRDELHLLLGFLDEAWLRTDEALRRKLADALVCAPRPPQ